MNDVVDFWAIDNLKNDKLIRQMRQTDMITISFILFENELGTFALV